MACPDPPGTGPDLTTGAPAAQGDRPQPLRRVAGAGGAVAAPSSRKTGRSRIREPGSSPASFAQNRPLPDDPALSQPCSIIPVSLQFRYGCAPGRSPSATPAPHRETKPGGPDPAAWLIRSFPARIPSMLPEFAEFGVLGPAAKQERPGRPVAGRTSGRATVRSVACASLGPGIEPRPCGVPPPVAGESVSGRNLAGAPVLVRADPPGDPRRPRSPVRWRCRPYGRSLVGPPAAAGRPIAYDLRAPSSVRHRNGSGAPVGKRHGGAAGQGTDRRRPGSERPGRSRLAVPVRPVRSITRPRPPPLRPGGRSARIHGTPRPGMPTGRARNAWSAECGRTRRPGGPAAPARRAGAVRSRTGGRRMRECRR